MMNKDMNTAALHAHEHEQTLRERDYQIKRKTLSINEKRSALIREDVHAITAVIADRLCDHSIAFNALLNDKDAIGIYQLILAIADDAVLDQY